MEFDPVNIYSCLPYSVIKDVGEQNGSKNILIELKCQFFNYTTFLRVWYKKMFFF